MKRLLIVDDDALVRASLARFLQKAGYEVETALDGLEALYKVKTFINTVEQFDFLIMDIRMPRMSGIELLVELRRVNINLPVVCITGYGSEEIENQLRDYDSVQYIEKPFAPDQLLTVIKNITGQTQISYT